MSGMEEDPMLYLNQQYWDDLFDDVVQPRVSEPTPKSGIFDGDESRIVYNSDDGFTIADAIRSLSGHRYTYNIDKQKTSSCTPLPKNIRIGIVEGLIRLIEDPDSPTS